MTVRAWGPAKWLLPKVGSKNWHLITSSSFEDRCIAVAEWVASSKQSIGSATLIKIRNPDSLQWKEGRPVVDLNFGKLLECLSGLSIKPLQIDLLSPMSVLLKDDPIGENSSSSVILDVTTLPKRFFLFALKRLVESSTVENLVITYARARFYPEIPLCENALPPTALQGFGRLEPLGQNARMVVGVGYVPLSVSELLEQAKHFKLDFIFPFPPASPAFRRNWKLLSMLLPEGEIPRNTEIHRVHAMDAFEVFERIMSWTQHGRADIDMIPLGPKPHAIGMAMAYLRLQGRAELIYSQPQAYGAKYSEGIALDEEGNPEIVAYCLKRNGVALF